ncbi:MAG: hypothetical protein ACOCVR_04570 [Myxococcota bacterium]
MPRSPSHLLFVLLLLTVPLAALAGKKDGPQPVPSTPQFRARGETPRSNANVNIQLGDEGALPAGLADRLRGLVEAVARRDLAGALSYFDPENRAAQAAIGMQDDAQYVIEGLGVAQYSRLAGPELRSPIDYEALFAGIEHISVTAVSVPEGTGGSVEARGELSFNEGRRYRMTLYLRHRKDLGWVVSPALG